MDRLLFGTDRRGNRGIDRIPPNPDRPDRGPDKCRSVPGRIPVRTRPEAITESTNCLSLGFYSCKVIVIMGGMQGLKGRMSVHACALTADSVSQSVSHHTWQEYL